MPHRPRRSRRRAPLPHSAAAVLAAAAVPLAAAPPAVAAVRPALWEAEAAAAGVHVVANTEPGLFPVATLVDLRAPDAESHWDSSGSASSRASSVYPGATGTGGPQLLCDFGVPCPEGFPPDYPETAFASYPATPQAATGSGFGKAHASRDGVGSSARLGNVANLDPLADVVTVDTAAAATDVRFADDGTLVVRAATRLHDVRLGGGALRVGLLETLAVSRGRGDAAETSTRVTLAGVSTASGEVVVSDRGVTVGGEGDDGESLRRINEALTAALEGSGVSARIVGTSRTAEGVATSGHAVGLVADLRREISGPPVPEASLAYRTYVATVVVGQAATRAFVSDDEFAVEAGLLPGVGGGPAAGQVGGGPAAGQVGGGPAAGQVGGGPAAGTVGGGASGGLLAAPAELVGAPLDAVGGGPAPDLAADGDGLGAAPDVAPQVPAGGDSRPFALFAGARGGGPAWAHATAAALAALVVGALRAGRRALAGDAPQQRR